MALCLSRKGHPHQDLPKQICVAWICPSHYQPEFSFAFGRRTHQVNLIATSSVRQLRSHGRITHVFNVRFSLWFQRVDATLFLIKRDVAMKRRTRIYYTPEQKAIIWDRYKQGDSLHDIARIFDRYHSSIMPSIHKTGGYACTHQISPRITCWAL